MAGQGRAARACFGLEVTDDGWVIEAAPIAAWTIGRRGRQVAGYYRQRGGRVSWVQVPSRLHYASHPLTGSAAELHAAVDALDASSPDAAPDGPAGSGIGTMLPP